MSGSHDALVLVAVPKKVPSEAFSLLEAEKRAFSVGPKNSVFRPFFGQNWAVFARFLTMIFREILVYNQLLTPIQRRTGDESDPGGGGGGV